MAFMRDANNLNWAFVSTYQGTASTGTVDAYTDLNDGEVVVLDRDNLITAGALSSGDEFKIAQRAGTELIVSPLFSFSSATALDYSAATQQVTTLGCSGDTAVFLDPDATTVADAAAAVGNSYYVLIEKQDNDEANRSGYQPAITAQAKLTNPDAHTAVALIQARLARQLRESIRANDALEASTPSPAGPKYLRCEVLFDLSSVTLVDPAGSGADFNATVTYGSKTVTLSADTTNEVAVGDYVCFGANSDMYRVEEVDTTGNGTYTLDFPYAGPTATFGGAATPSATTFSRLTEAELDDATGIGLRLSGQAQHSFDVERERIHGVSRFNVRFAKDGENVGAVKATTAAVEGVNDFRTVLTDFYTSQGQLGQRWVSDTPGVSRTVPATTSTTTNAFNTDSVGFGLIDIPLEVSKNTLMWRTTAKQRVRLYLAFRDGNTADGINGESQTDMETVFGVAGVITDYSA